MVKIYKSGPGIGFLDKRYILTTGDTMTGDLQTVDLILSGGDIYPTADSTTAIQINKADGTTNVLNVDTTNGRVGIGTATPGYKLELSANNERVRLLGTTGYVLLDIRNDAGSFFVGKENSSGGGLATGSIAYAGVINSQNAFPIQLAVNSNIAMTIIDGGNVGIGTTGPLSKLNVVVGNVAPSSSGNMVNGVTIMSDNTHIGMALGATQTGYSWIQSAYGDSAQTETSLVLNPNGGNVGIGTTGPGSKLEVRGNTAQIEISNPDTGGDDWFLASTDNAWGAGGGKFLITPDGSSANARLVIDSSGNVGIGTINPLRILGLGGLVARNIGMERGTVANTAGFALTVNAGGATAAATDKAGGDLILNSGVSTGSAESGVQIKGCVAGASGTADRTQTTAIQVLGNKVGFYAVTPVVRPTALTTQLTTITHTAPGTPDYAIQNLTTTTPYGFVTADEGNTVLSTIANLQTRVAELEAKLQALGLLT